VLDGQVVRADHQEPLAIVGIYGRHGLDRIPQVEYRCDVEGLKRALDRDYWLKARERKRRTVS
jgi:hypothetical protein